MKVWHLLDESTARDPRTSALAPTAAVHREAYYSWVHC